MGATARPAPRCAPRRRRDALQGDRGTSCPPAKAHRRRRPRATHDRRTGKILPGPHYAAPRNQIGGHPMPARFTPSIRAAFTGFAFAMAATCWCAWATGPGLGLFLGATLLAALYVPALTLAEISPQRWMTALATALGVFLCWGLSLGWSDINLNELFRCTLVFTTFVLALAGTASVLGRIGLAAPLAAGIVVMVAMLWLTWPVWLSHALNQTILG